MPKPTKGQPRPPIKLLPSADYLRACFDYDPLTGALTRKTRPREHFNSDQAWRSYNWQNAGKPVDHTQSLGYVSAKIDYVNYRANRIIWKMMTGEEPPPIVDHEDRDRTKNRWVNLRIATHRESTINQNRKPGNSGYRGVIERPYGRFEANIRDGKIKRYLGCFSTPEEASEAFEKAARELHGEFYRPPNRW